MGIQVRETPVVPLEEAADAAMRGLISILSQYFPATYYFIALVLLILASLFVQNVVEAMSNSLDLPKVARQLYSNWNLFGLMLWALGVVVCVLSQRRVQLIVLPPLMCLVFLITCLLHHSVMHRKFCQIVSMRIFEQADFLISNEKTIYDSIEASVRMVGVENESSEESSIYGSRPIRPDDLNPRVAKILSGFGLGAPNVVSYMRHNSSVGWVIVYYEVPGLFSIPIRMCISGRHDLATATSDVLVGPFGAADICLSEHLYFYVRACRETIEARFLGERQKSVQTNGNQKRQP